MESFLPKIYTYNGVEEYGETGQWQLRPLAQIMACRRVCVTRQVAIVKHFIRQANHRFMGPIVPSEHGNQTRKELSRRLLLFEH